MTRKSLTRCLMGVCTVGLLLRVLAWHIEPELHPDEFFQYLEPAWLRLSGVGLETWEWRDGVRSWVLPGYNGAWMALLRSLGLSGGRIVRLIQLHWAILSMLLVWAGFRGGCTLTRHILANDSPHRVPPTRSADDAPEGWQGGILGAAFCACFPLLVLQAPHTLSETPSMLALVIGLVLSVEALDKDPAVARRLAGWSGACAALGICLRIANGPLAVVPWLVLVVARRWRLVTSFLLGSTLPVLFFGLVDWVTWGSFLSSYVGYVRFNFVDGGAARYGVAPFNWYLQLIIGRLPAFIGLFTLSLLLAPKKVIWPYAVAALGLLTYLSTQGHKEERFIVAFWPFFLIPVAGVVGAWLSRLEREEWHAQSRWKTSLQRVLGSERAQVSALALLVLLTTMDSFLHSARRGFDPTQSWLKVARTSRGILDAQAWLGTRNDVMGILAPQGGGGYATLGNAAPMVGFDGAVRATLVRNPTLNYAIVIRDSVNDELVRQAGFTLLLSAGSVDVYRRDYESQRDQDRGAPRAARRESP